MDVTAGQRASASDHTCTQARVSVPPRFVTGRCVKAEAVPARSGGGGALRCRSSGCASSEKHCMLECVPARARNSVCLRESSRALSYRARRRSRARPPAYRSTTTCATRESASTAPTLATVTATLGAAVILHRVWRVGHGLLARVWHLPARRARLVHGQRHDRSGGHAQVSRAIIYQTLVLLHCVLQRLCVRSAALDHPSAPCSVGSEMWAAISPTPPSWSTWCPACS